MIPYREALRLSPDEPVYLRALAELHSDLGEPGEALPLAQRAVEVAPDRAANHVTYGYVASAAGDKELARREYEQAVTLDPSDAAAWNNLGCLDLQARRPLRARARFREALRLDPRAERARRNLELVRPPGAPRPARSWDDVVTALADELVRARAPLALVGALVLEAPAAARALVRGGDRGAALSGAALALALGAMGRAAWLPLSLGAAAAGTAWLVGRRRLGDERARVRARLADGRVEHAAIVEEWLDGRLPRAARDAAVEALVERMAIALAGDP
jgi:tetratricopeptide (TPR) repeat protein